MSIGALVVIVVLLAVNGFFVALEFALLGSRRSRLEPRADAGDRTSRLGLDAVRDLTMQLAGAQLGITIASLVLGRVGEPAVAHGLVSLAELAGWSHGSWVHPVALIISLLLVVFAHLVLGEMVPKNLALAKPELALRLLVVPARAWLFIARPFVVAFNAVANVGVRMFGVEPRDELATSHTAEEIAVLVAVSHEEGAIPETAAELLSGVLEFGDETVRSVMIGRSDIVAVPVSMTVRDAENIARESVHQRIPLVGDGGIDDVVGFVSAKDLAALPAESVDEPIPTRLVRRILIVGQDEALDDLLRTMRRTRVHIAIVVGADESTVGLVTLDDLLNDLVGELLDED